MSEEERTGVPDEVYERRWAILAVMSLSLVIVILNNVTLNVALPELSKDCLLYTSPSPRDS